MNCDWRNFDEPNTNGWRRVICVRCTLRLNPTPHSFDNIINECQAWPRWWEWGSWLALIIATLWLDHVARVVAPISTHDDGSCDSCAGREVTINDIGRIVKDAIS